MAKIPSRPFLFLGDYFFYRLYVFCDFDSFFCEFDDFDSAFFLEADESDFFEGLEDFYGVGICTVDFFCELGAVFCPGNFFESYEHHRWLSSEK